MAVCGDGGGTSPSWRAPIFGRDRALKLLVGMGRHSRQRGVTIRRTEINGQPGALFLDPSGRLMYVMTIDVAGGVVQTVRSIINPATLRHLGSLADVRGLDELRRTLPIGRVVGPEDVAALAVHVMTNTADACDIEGGQQLVG